MGTKPLSDGCVTPRSSTAVLPCSPSSVTLSTPTESNSHGLCNWTELRSLAKRTHLPCGMPSPTTPSGKSSESSSSWKPGVKSAPTPTSTTCEVDDLETSRTSTRTSCPTLSHSTSGILLDSPRTSPLKNPPVASRLRSTTDDWPCLVSSASFPKPPSLVPFLPFPASSNHTAGKSWLLSPKTSSPWLPANKCFPNQANAASLNIQQQRHRDEAEGSIAVYDAWK